MLVTQWWPPSVFKVRELLILLRLWRYELCEWCTLETMRSFVIVHDSWLSSSLCKLSHGTQAKVAGQTGVICLPGLIRNHSSFACTCTYMLVSFFFFFFFFFLFRIWKSEIHFGLQGFGLPITQKPRCSPCRTFSQHVRFIIFVRLSSWAVLEEMD